MLRKALVCAVLIVGGGCGSTYYRINPPGTDKSYYTTGYQDLGFGQGVRFTDMKTGAQVTLPASEIHKISKDEVPADVLQPTTKP